MLYLTGMGMSNQINKIDREDIIKLAIKNQLVIEDIYELDSTFYDFIIMKEDSSNHETVNDYLQILLAMYFDKTACMKSFFVSCYAEGFPNLNWNREKNFEIFPPTQQSGHTAVALVNFYELKPFLKQISQTDNIDFDDFDNFDNFVVVFWNKFTGRQSKRLIKLVSKNAKLAPNNVKKLYVNTDNFFFYKLTRSIP
jgi:hypothetical protein